MAPEPTKSAGSPRRNMYVCKMCGHTTITTDVALGVTPFMLRCVAEVEGVRCKGFAESRMYPRDIPEKFGPPTHEWFRPSAELYYTLRQQKGMAATIAHLDKGGLDLRKRTDAPELTHEDHPKDEWAVIDEEVGKMQGKDIIGEAVFKAIAGQERRKSALSVYRNRRRGLARINPGSGKIKRRS